MRVGRARASNRRGLVLIRPSCQGGAFPVLRVGYWPAAIFNPGSENPTLAERLEASGAEVVAAWMLVLLATGRFD